MQQNLRTTDFQRFQNANAGQAVETRQGKWKDYVGLMDGNNFKMSSYAKVAAYVLLAMAVVIPGAALVAAPLGGITLLGSAFKQAAIRERGEQARDQQLGYNPKRFLKNTARYLV